MYLVLSSAQIILNWENIKNDPDNNNPEITNVYEYIQKAKEGLVFAGGVQVIVSDELTKFG